MLILCSNGLSSEKLLKAAADRAKKVKTAALVVTADHIYKEKNYHVNRGMNELERLLKSVDETGTYSHF